MTSPLPHLNMIQGLLGFAAFAGLLIWESVFPFFPFFRQALKARVRHLAQNVVIGLINAALTAACFLFLWSKGAAWSAQAGYGLLYRFGLPLWMHACAAILLLDMWTYWWHRANHRKPWLWRFHRVHHSDPCMDVSSARRFHPGEILLSSALRLPLLVLLGIHLWELMLYETLLMLSIDFHHANIALPEPTDRLLRVFVATPAMHKVHHSRIRVDTDSNYTSLFSLWDRLFGTFRLRPDLSAIKLGLDGWSGAPHQTLSGMLATPCRNQPDPVLH